MTGTASTDKRRETVTSFVRRNREAGKSRIFSYYALELDDLERLLAIAEAARPIADEIESRAAREAYEADFGASEWRGFTSKTEDAFIEALAAFRDPETER